jgi:uncharacterized RDD family membrane protein YckC
MSADARQIDSTIDVVTPENISFRYQLAGPFRRFPAFVIDLAIRVSILISMFILVVATGFLGPGGSTLGITLTLLAWFVLEWFYGGLLETFWNGQTVGKRMLGMRVLQIDGQPINGLQAVMRNILRLVDMMPLIPLGAGIGEEGPWPIPTCLIGLLVPIAWGGRYQRLGDLVCGTMVVVEERHWLAAVAKIDDPATCQLAAVLPPDFQVSHLHSQALASYVERRRYLSALRRAGIARHLGEPLVARFGLPAETDHDRLLCALYYRTFVVPTSERQPTSTASRAAPIAPVVEQDAAPQPAGSEV